MWESPPFRKLQEAIEEPSNPIGMRMRAAYFLRQTYDNAMNDNHNHNDNHNDNHIDNDEKKDVTEVVIETLGAGLTNKEHGSLLRHEFAYVMGQLRDVRCCPTLEDVLSDKDDCVMVRHECAEALGAIGAQRSISTLQATMELNPSTPELYQTCDIAIAHMQWRIHHDALNTLNAQNAQNTLNTQNTQNAQLEVEEEPMACACMLSPYNSIDPAPPHPNHIHLSTMEIYQILHNDKLPLFQRYRAMFSLRNRGGNDSVRALGKVLVEDTSSALLRHEIAYVLGQMQHPASIDALGESLRRSKEHEMVRHEAAEALGAIDAGDRWQDCESILKEFLQDEDVVVRESCVVALDAADYWGNPNHDPNHLNHDDESFGKQKAISNGRTNDTNDTKDALMNHFNVQPIC